MDHECLHLACTTVLMATGTLADRFGRKRVFGIAILLFGFTSLFCGIAQNAKVLIVSRFLQGVTGGAMLVSQVAVLSHQFREDEERARAFSMWGVIFGIGLGLTNTPVTNTTTGSVPSTRAGMASGIDMSARLISLGANIALMGFVLVNGIFAYLKDPFLDRSVHPSCIH